MSKKYAIRKQTTIKTGEITLDDSAIILSAVSAADGNNRFDKYQSNEFIVTYAILIEED